MRALLTPIGLRSIRRRAGQRAQALIIFAFMFVVLVGVVGLAVDGVLAYYYSVSLERAAASAALAGVPYLPNSLGTATTRARGEAQRNGYTDPGNSTITITDVSAGSNGQLRVKIAASVPTYFMQALGVPAYNISRTAIAGYRPPISLGQPSSQLASTVSQLGAGSQFYFLRFKGWKNIRSEGDAFTPSPCDSGSTSCANTSIDVHTISQSAGAEDPEVYNTDQGCSGPVGSNPLPCRGGYNYRVVVPPGVTDVEVDVYNMAFGPDFGRVVNYCENDKTLNNCNANPGYNYAEQDSGNFACTNAATCAAQAGNYLSTKWSMFNVPDIFLRGNDKLLTQTQVDPIDATNWDCDGGNTGKGGKCLAGATPTYVNVNDGSTINQKYDAPGNPCNMKVYHAWADVVNYTGTVVAPCAAGDGSVTSHSYVGCASPCNVNGGATGLGPGTYRLRGDALQTDRTIGTNTLGSKGYAVRAIHKGGAACTECTVAAWEDMCVFSPIGGTTGTMQGTIPLFELTKDYQGATINVDVFDVGDGGATDGSNPWSVDLEILDNTNNRFSVSSGTLAINNNGINRGASPLTGHTPPQAPIPQGTGAIGHAPFAAAAAGERSADSNVCDSNGACGPKYQGEWIHFVLPIPATYDPGGGNDFWSLRYTLTNATVNDTFTFAVSASGGPVRLISS
jgi:hypothetical protein